MDIIVVLGPKTLHRIALGGLLVAVETFVQVVLRDRNVVTFYDLLQRDFPRDLRYRMPHVDVFNLVFPLQA